MTTLGEMWEIYKSLAEGPDRKIDEVGELREDMLSVRVDPIDTYSFRDDERVLWRDEHGPVYPLRGRDRGGRVGLNRNGGIYVDPEKTRPEQRAIRYHELGHNQYEDQTLATLAGMRLLLEDMLSKEREGKDEEVMELSKAYKLMKNMERVFRTDPLQN